MSDRPVTVADLIKALRALPQDAMVVLAKDGEGNGYSPIARPLAGGGVAVGWYEAESTWSGEWWQPGDEDTMSTVPGDGDAAAVCLWPTN